MTSYNVFCQHEYSLLVSVLVNGNIAFLIILVFAVFLHTSVNARSKLAKSSSFDTKVEVTGHALIPICLKSIKTRES